jgi:hypothetical protein
MAFDATYIEWTTDSDDVYPRAFRDGAGQEISRAEGIPLRKANRERRSRERADRATHDRPREQRPDRARRGPTRAARYGIEEFKCRHCRAFIGPTVGGGRHRNHCPFCLHSRHVDDRRPGDRASDCGATMAPVARFDRPGGEPVLIHRCLGCGLERHNRLAADDNIALLTRLPLVAPRLGQRVPSVAGDAGLETGGREERAS